MIEVDVDEAQANAPQEQWIRLWEKTSAPAVYGLEASLQHNIKLYRGYAAVMLGDTEKRIFTETFEACDAADIDPASLARGSIVPGIVWREERARAEAEAARSLMTSGMRSPKDMEALALALAQELNQVAREYDRQAMLAAQQRAYDEGCLAVARPLVHGLKLLLDHGSDEEKATLRYVFRGK